MKEIVFGSLYIHFGGRYNSKFLEEFSEDLYKRYHIRSRTIRIEVRGELVEEIVHWIPFGNMTTMRILYECEVAVLQFKDSLMYVKNRYGAPFDPVDEKKFMIMKLESVPHEIY